MEPSNLKFVEITQHHINVFENLAQAYEAEFSNLTQKIPNELGLFKIDTFPYEPYRGYLVYYQEIPVGFCIVNIKNQIKDVAEFYIVPAMRKRNLGYELAIMIFNQYPGEWQVRQIIDAIDATHFWRKVIKKYTKNNYQEAIIEDPDWGKVTRQRFHSIIEKNQTHCHDI